MLVCTLKGEREGEKKRERVRERVREREREKGIEGERADKICPKEQGSTEAKVISCQSKVLSFSLYSGKKSAIAFFQQRQKTVGNTKQIISQGPGL